MFMPFSARSEGGILAKGKGERKRTEKVEEEIGARCFSFMILMFEILHFIYKLSGGEL